MPTNVPAHITGTVWKIEKNVGDEVAEGDVIVILESMKMEMPIEAPSAGTIKEIKVKEGQPVDEGAVVAVIVEERSGGSAPSGGAPPTRRARARALVGALRPPPRPAPGSPPRP